jgi:hypothetical protein
LSIVTRRSIAQGLALTGLAAGLGYLVVSSADSWGDWVVFGVVVLTAFGAALAVHQREHPARRRAFSRSSSDRR